MQIYLFTHSHSLWLIHAYATVLLKVFFCWSRSWRRDICVVHLLWELAFKALMLTRDQWITQCYLLPTRLSTNGISHPAFTSQSQRITALWSILISRPTEGRRLSRPGWLVIYWDVMSARRGSLIPFSVQQLNWNYTSWYVHQTTNSLLCFVL